MKIEKLFWGRQTCFASYSANKNTLGVNDQCAPDRKI